MTREGTPDVGAVGGRSAPGHGFQQHIHVFRALAAILIVLTHVVPSFDWSARPRLGWFIDSLVSGGSIYFAFISGYLALGVSQHLSYRAYLLRKVKRVVVPYLVLSIPALVLFTVFVPRAGIPPWVAALSPWWQVPLFLVTGMHLPPLWFIPPLLLLYTALPLFRWIDAGAPWAYWGLVPLAVFSVYFGPEAAVAPVGGLLYLLPVYLVGMLYSRDAARSEAFVVRWWPILLTLAVLGVVARVMAWPLLPGYMIVTKVPVALLAVVVLGRWHKVFGNRLDAIGHASYGIFFVHSYAIALVKAVTVYVVHGRAYLGGGSRDLEGGVIAFTAYSLVVLVMTLGTLRLAQRILGPRSRLVVGA